VNQESNWRQAALMLKSWRRTLILSHVRPDGDALGAMAAMVRIIENRGRLATAYIDAPLPKRYHYLERACTFRDFSEIGDDLDSRFDGIVILDTCSWSQLDTFREKLEASQLPRIVVDHHATGDPICLPGRDYCLTDATAAAACVLVYEWAISEGWPLDLPTAEALFTGLVTDTGWLRFSNTDERCFQAAADLRSRGLRPDIIYGLLYESFTPARVRLKAAVLNTLRFEADSHLAVMHLTPDMFKEAGAVPADAEELVNEPMVVEQVWVTVMLTDQGDGVTRVNFRSKSPEVCLRDIDVSAIARTFDGGGHHRAAGARLQKSLEETTEAVIKAVVEAIH
jgi:phosphoesterase RecJ-like protein